MGNEEKLALGHTLAEVDNGMPNSILTDCEAYGMVSGCDENCPVLIAGKCELQDTDNKLLYELAKTNMIMKELSIEEKAKRFDEVLAMAKKELNTCGLEDCDAARQIYRFFPELKNEDERIRKVLIDWFNRYKEEGTCGSETFNGIPTDNIIAWLEKQVPVDEDEIVKGIRRGVAISLMNHIDANSKGMCLSNMECEDIENAIVNEDWDKVYGYMKKKLEKQGEQKSIWHNEDEEPQRDSLILLIMQSGTPIVAKVVEPNHTFNHGERWAYIDDLLEKQGE